MFITKKFIDRRTMLRGAGAAVALSVVYGIEPYMILKDIWGLPDREVERTGPHHDPQFRVAVDLPGLAPAEGLGGSKRAAEKVAASVMIAREGVGGSNDS